jgi:hypothetical protein
MPAMISNRTLRIRFYFFPPPLSPAQLDISYFPAFPKLRFGLNRHKNEKAVYAVPMKSGYP